MVVVEDGQEANLASDELESFESFLPLKSKSVAAGRPDEDEKQDISTRKNIKLYQIIILSTSETAEELQDTVTNRFAN